MHAKVVSLSVLFLATVLAGCLGGNQDVQPADPIPGEGGAGDAVVVAVVDSGFNPYHWDLAAHLMPQHQNDEPSDDLPLDQDPMTWLPGFPGAEAFSDYGALDLTLDAMDPGANMADLYSEDVEKWDAVPRSMASAVAYRWIPDTKVVGFVNFQAGEDNTGFGFATHGMGSASVSAGNIHGTCPECVLVFVNGPSEVANEWVAQQDWIDVQTNSWGLSTVMRDRLYTKSDTELQREASERGQTIFFSAGNGQANAFVAPNPTLFSSQEGPDWIVTVGAIDPNDRASYSGHGKPADVANIGSGYPRAGGGNVTSEGSFGGTSNATPVTAGLYAKALYELRKEMVGASRVQQAGTIAVGDLACGAAAPGCATGDGALSVHELREALFRAAENTGAGWKTSTPNPPSSVEDVELPAIDVPELMWPTSDEMAFMAQGHGAFVGLLDGPDAYDAQHERITGFATGAWHDEQDADLHAWMVADSYCRQMLWGTWDHGYYEGELPDSDRAGAPLRTWLVEDCPAVGEQVIYGTRTVEVLRGGAWSMAG